MFLLTLATLALADNCVCEGHLIYPPRTIEPCDETLPGGCECACAEDEDGNIVCSNEAGPIPEGTVCDEGGEPWCSGEQDCDETDDGCSSSGTPALVLPLLVFLPWLRRRTS